MIKIEYFIPILLFATLLISCKEETNAYIDANAPAPAQVSDIKAEATPGGAIITYKIPIDPNLSYVKAEYEIQQGVFREAKSSYYANTLELVGFGDTLSHVVKLYSIGKNGKESKVIPITVKPLIPPVFSVFETLTLDPTFSGVSVSFQNSTQAELSIVVLVDTTGQNKWVPVTTYYTRSLGGVFIGRGIFDATERNFAVFVRDRWNNKSDTLIKSLTTFPEQLIDKTLFKLYKLPGDNWETAYPTYTVEKLWDNIVGVNSNMFAPLEGAIRPRFTVDLGQSVIFSRMKLYQRLNHMYEGEWVKQFEIWGSNAPDADGEWLNWQRLGEFNSVKPSGLPDPQYTAEDLAMNVAGEDFNFGAGIPAVRYIRFVMVMSRSETTWYVFREFTFWGVVK